MVNQDNRTVAQMLGEITWRLSRAVSCKYQFATPNNPYKQFTVQMALLSPILAFVVT